MRGTKTFLQHAREHPRRNPGFPGANLRVCPARSGGPATNPSMVMRDTPMYCGACARRLLGFRSSGGTGGRLGYPGGSAR
eukprot:5379492-Pyramimonas_sp.AAC.1